MTLLRGALLMMLVVVAGCRAAPIYNATDLKFAEPASQSAVQLEEYKQAIIRGGAKRGWTFEEVGPGHLLGNVAVRGKHFATVDVTFDTQRFSITYNNSVNLNYDADRQEIHPNYNSWVNFLREDIQAEVSRIGA